MSKSKEDKEEEALTEYKKAIKSSWTEYTKVEGPAYVKHMKVDGPAYAEYTKRMEEIEDES
jgi:hypothetical protein